MRGGVAVLAGGLALVVFVGIAAAGPPLVSAGLDQDVTQGDPVYLDAGGTHVPDGDLASLEWSIETPNGSTIDPNCVDCEVTWFRANQTGQYEVRLTAESASGQERFDTLYVTVDAWSASSTPAVNVTTPVNVANTGSSDSMERCFIGNEGDNGRAMDQGICSQTGDVVGVNIDDSGNNIMSYIVEPTGNLLLWYDGIEYAGDGRYRVPTDSIHYQSEDLWEAYQDDSEGLDLDRERSVAISRESSTGSKNCDPRVPTYYC